MRCRVSVDRKRAVESPTAIVVNVPHAMNGDETKSDEPIKLFLQFGIERPAAPLKYLAVITFNRPNGRKHVG